MTLAELIVKVGADISDYTKGIDEAVGKASTMESAFDGIGVAMTAAITAPLAALGTAALESAATMKEAFNQIIVQTGATGDKLNDLKGSMANVFAGVPESARQVADAISSISQRLDLTGEPLQALSTQMLNLARITGSEVKPMVDSVAKAFNAFKISTDQQGESLDFLFSVFQHTGATVQSLTDGLTQYGAQFKSLGLDFEQSAALLGEFEKEGVNAGAAMTGLRKALSEMAKTGLDTSNGFADIIDWIKKASTETEGLQRSMEIFGGKGGAAMFQAIKAGVVDVQALTTAMAASKDQINSTADKVETFGEKLTKLWHGVEEALAPIGNVLRGLMNSGFDALQPLLGILQDLSRAFQELDPFTQKVVVSLGLLAAAAGPAALAIGKLANTQAIGSVVSAFSQLMSTGAALEGGALTGFLGALPALAIPAAAALTGLALAWSQFHMDTEGLRSLDATFNQMLVDMTKGTIGPLTDGVGRFDQVIQTLNKSLEAGVITLDQFNKLMLMVDANQKAADKADMSAWSSSFGLKILPTSGKDGGKVNPLELAKQQEAAKQYAADLASAFSTLGVTDYVTQIQKLKDAYELLAGSGKATGQELSDAWFKVQQASDAYEQSLKGITETHPFDASSLGIDPLKLDAVAESAKSHLDAIREQSKAFWKDQAEFIENFDTSTASSLQAALDKYQEARQQVVANGLIPDFSSANTYSGMGKVPASPGTSLADLRAYADAAEQVVGTLDSLKIPANVTTDLNTFFGALAKGLNQDSLTAAARLQTSLKLLGVSARDDAAAMQGAFATVEAAYQQGAVSEAAYVKSRLAVLQSMAAEAKAQGQAIVPAMSSEIYALQTKLANMTKDVWTGVHNEVTSLVGTLDDGLSKAILDFGNFGKDMEQTFKRMGQQLLDTVFKAFTKPFADQLAKSISDAVAPIASKISGWLTNLAGGGSSIAGAVSAIPNVFGGAASAVPGIAANGLPAVGGLLPAIPGISGAAGGAASVAGTAGSLLSSIGSIANIAGAVSSIASGIVSGIQGAHMNNLLGEIEVSTRGSLNEALNLRRDAWDQHNMLLSKFDMIFDRLGDIWKDMNEGLGKQYDRLAALVGGAGAATVSADGSVTAPETVFSSLVDAVTAGTRDIVDAVNGAADRIVTGVTTPAAPLPVATDTPPAATPEPAPAGVPVDSAPPVFSPVGFASTTPLPENQAVVMNLLLVNESVNKASDAIVKQLQSMAGIGGGTGTGGGSDTGGPGGSSSGTSTSDGSSGSMQALFKSLVDQGASHDEILQQMVAAGAQNAAWNGGAFSFTEGRASGGAAPAESHSVTPSLGPSPGETTPQTPGYIPSWGTSSNVTLGPAALGPDAGAPGSRSNPLTGQAGIAEISRQIMIAQGAGDYGAAQWYQQMINAMTPDVGPGRNQGGIVSATNLLYPNQNPENQGYMQAPLNWDQIWNERNAMPDTVWPGSPLVPGSVNPGNMRGGIIIQNNTFQSRGDIDYLLNLVRNLA